MTKLCSLIRNALSPAWISAGAVMILLAGGSLVRAAVTLTVDPAVPASPAVATIDPEGLSTAQRGVTGTRELRQTFQNAADFIVEQVKRHPGQVTLLAVGPLQNVADALRKEPDLGKYVKRVVLMSGCVYGTASDKDKPIREWNVYQSTADAQLVYGAGLPLTIVPLDSTTYLRLTDEERKQVRDYKSPLTFALECLYRLWIENPNSRMTLHDQLAVAEAASPTTFFGKHEVLPLIVDAEGYTRIDRERGKPVTVCLEPKRDEFMKYYIGELIQQRLGM